MLQLVTTSAISVVIPCSSVQDMDWPNLWRILHTKALPVMLLIPTPMHNCLAGLAYPFVTPYSISEPKELASRFSFSDGFVGFVHNNSKQKSLHTLGTGAWPFLECVDVRTKGKGRHVLAKSNNRCLRCWAALMRSIWSAWSSSKFLSRKGTSSSFRTALYNTA